MSTSVQERRLRSGLPAHRDGIYQLAFVRASGKGQGPSESEAAASRREQGNCGSHENLGAAEGCGWLVQGFESAEAKQKSHCAEHLLG